MTIGNTLLDAIIGNFVGYRISTLANAITESVKESNKGLLYLTPNGIVINGALVAEPNQVLKLRLNGASEDTIIGEYIGAEGATGSGVAFDIKTGSSLGSVSFEGVDVKINGSNHLTKITGTVVTDIQFSTATDKLQFKYADDTTWHDVPSWPSAETFVRNGLTGGSITLTHNTTDDTVKTTLSTKSGEILASNTLTINHVAHAVKATQDDNGNPIITTYATKAEMDALLNATDALVLAGSVDGSGNISNWNNVIMGTKPASPATINLANLNTYVDLGAGWVFVFTSAGTFLGKPVEAGDTIIIVKDAVKGTVASLTSDYYVIVQNNLDIATTDVAGVVKIAAAKRSSAITTTQGGSISTRHYGLELDANNKAFVNVPWVAVSHVVGSGLTVTDPTTNDSQTVTTNLNVALKTAQSNSTANITLNDKTSDALLATVDLPLAQAVTNAGLMTRAQSDKLAGLPGVIGATNSAGTATSFKVASITMDGASKLAANMKLAYTPNSSTGATLYIQDANNGNANLADIAIPKGTTTNYGLAKLVTSRGDGEDVVMTQKAVTELILALEAILTWQ